MVILCKLCECVYCQSYPPLPQHIWFQNTSWQSIKCSSWGLTKHWVISHWFIPPMHPTSIVEDTSGQDSTSRKALKIVALKVTQFCNQPLYTDGSHMWWSAGSPAQIPVIMLGKNDCCRSHHFAFFLWLIILAGIAVRSCIKDFLSSNMVAQTCSFSPLRNIWFQ